jgi:pimeloyl-ACP methyl ester carboxylesterase
VSALAIERPELVRAVVAVDPGYGRDDALSEMAAALIRLLEESRDLGPALQAFEHMDTRATPPAVRTWHRRRLLGTPYEVLLQSLRALSEHEGEFFSRAGAESYMPQRRCPVLSIQTSADQAAWEQTIMSHPCSTSVTWTELGHWVHQERPEAFNRLVLDWIDRLPPPSPSRAEGTSPCEGQAEIH